MTNESHKLIHVIRYCSKAVRAAKLRNRSQRRRVFKKWHNASNRYMRIANKALNQ